MFVRNKAAIGGVMPVGGGDYSLSTATKRFGAASLQRKGVGQWAAPFPLALGSQDFCIEGWAQWDASNTGNAALFYLQQDGSPSVHYELYRRPGSGNALVLYDNAGGNRITGGTAIAPDTLKHCAFYRVGNDFYISLDGVVQGTWNQTGVNWPSVLVGIGGYNSSLNSETMSGFVDEVRFTIGAARYGASNFTPPAAAFGADLASDPLWNKVMLLYSFDAIELAEAKRFALRTLVKQAAPARSSLARLHGVQRVTNPSLDGLGRIRGTTQIKGSPNQPERCRLVLLHELSRQVVAETWSDAAGVWSFDFLSMNATYTVLAYDHEGKFRAVTANKLSPEPMQ